MCEWRDRKSEISMLSIRVLLYDSTWRKCIVYTIGTVSSKLKLLIVAKEADKPQDWLKESYMLTQQV